MKKGTIMAWKDTGIHAYEKIDDLEWGSWRSLEYELERPIERRTGFKWPDNQVIEYYSSIMKFINPENEK